MEKILKQAIGIDCAKNDFAVSHGFYYENSRIEITANKTMLNSNVGFEKLEHFIKKYSKKDIPLIFVMEATGVYHERLACYLFDKGFNISVVLPQRAKAFMKTLKTKTVTDKESSKGLTAMGLEKNLDLWQKPDPVFNELKQITREREQIQKLLTQTKNQLHAEKASAWPNKNSIKRMNQLHKMYEKQLREIEEEVKKIIASKESLEQRVSQITTIPGIGIMTAAIVIAETNGFNLILNKKQLVSYSGYDVVEKTSGISIRGKAHISHKGNRHIRRAMHMPAIGAIRHSENNKELFKRLVSKHGIKMKGVVAVQRKLLVLIYTLWKNQENYNPEMYIQKKVEQSSKTALMELDLVRSCES